MKNKLTLLILLFPLYLFSDITPGISLGVNFPWISGDDVETEFRAIAYGVYISGDLEFFTSKRFAFNPSIAYSVKGGRWKYDRDDGSTASDWSRAKYLELPLDLKIKFLKDKKVSLFIKAGISPSLFLGATKNVTVSGENVLNESYNIAARNYDLGIGLGGGVEMPLLKGCISISSKCTIGLFSVDGTNDMNVKNRSVSLVLGYLFCKGKGNE